jgi:tripartite-type tricarboxylate transporter receptor subunit TctC
MKLARRRLLQFAAAAAALPALPRAASAQVYPSRPVRIVIGFAPGGVSDLYARLAAQMLSERLGQQFVVDNRTGAGGSIATESVVRAAPDGYTLLLTGANDAFNTALYDRLSFDYLRDIEPVAALVHFEGVLVVHPAFPATTTPAFITQVKARPGRVTMASAGVGSAPHIFWELFKSTAGIDMVHVPYRGEGPALLDLLGGQVQALMATIPASIEYIKAGRLRALAVTGAARSEALPDVPILADFVPGYEAGGWLGIAAPRNTSMEIVEKLNSEINAGLADTKIRSRISEQSASVFIASHAEFSKSVVEYTDKWAKVIRAANIKAE